MKQLFACLLLLSCGLINAQTKNSDTTTKKTKTVTTTKYTDNVDDRMKGPKGEKVYIGPNGGRYYLKDGKKVYVEYKGNKKKPA